MIKLRPEKHSHKFTAYVCKGRSYQTSIFSFSLNNEGILKTTQEKNCKDTTEPTSNNLPEEIRGARLQNHTDSRHKMPVVKSERFVKVHVTYIT